MQLVDHKLAQQLRRTKKAEDLKSLFRKLKHVTSIGHCERVTRVEIPRHDIDDPKACTIWIQNNVPSKVVRRLQQRNRSYFGEALGTPFTIPPLASDLCFDGITPAGQGNVPKRSVVEENKNVVFLRWQGFTIGEY